MRKLKNHLRPKSHNETEFNANPAAADPAAKWKLFENYDAPHTPVRFPNGKKVIRSKLERRHRRQGTHYGKLNATSCPSCVGAVCATPVQLVPVDGGYMARWGLERRRYLFSHAWVAVMPFCVCQMRLTVMWRRRICFLLFCRVRRLHDLPVWSCIVARRVFEWKHFQCMRQSGCLAGAVHGLRWLSTWTRLNVLHKQYQFARQMLCRLERMVGSSTQKVKFFDSPFSSSSASKAEIFSSVLNALRHSSHERRFRISPVGGSMPPKKCARARIKLC